MGSKEDCRHSNIAGTNQYFRLRQQEQDAIDQIDEWMCMSDPAVEPVATPIQFPLLTLSRTSAAETEGIVSIIPEAKPA